MAKGAVHLRVLPETRGECQDGERPCPFVSCRYHLLLDVHPVTGRLYMQVDFDADDPSSVASAICDLEETCALDVAERGDDRAEELGHGLTLSLSLEEIGELLGIPKENVHVIERRALSKVAVLVADAHPDDPYFRIMAEQELKKTQR